MKYYIILSPEQLLPSWNPCKEFLGIKSECSHAQAFVSPHSESLCNLHMFAIANLVFWQGFSAIAAAMSVSPSQILQFFLLKCKAYLQGLGGWGKRQIGLQLSLLEPLIWYFNFVTKVFTEILTFKFVTKMFAINFVTKTCHVWFSLMSLFQNWRYAPYLITGN